MILNDLACPWFKFCTGSLKVASDQMSHNMIGLDHKNSRIIIIIIIIIIINFYSAKELGFLSHVYKFYK